MSKNFDVSTRTNDGELVTGPESGNRDSQRNRLPARRGLAPLEMVLVLPVLMMLMATLIVLGFASSWKLRTETVARDVAWRARWHRFANDNARSIEWPGEGGMQVQPGNNLIVFANEPVLQDPVIAGPLGRLPVNQEVLNFSRSVINGVATLDRPPPVFAKLTNYDFRVNHEVLDDRFQFHQMGIGNYSRRVPLIYETGLEEIHNSDDYRRALAELWRAILALRER